MTARSLYRTAAGEAELASLYQRQLARLTIAHESRMLETGFGPTHVLAAGPLDAPPLVALHGSCLPGPYNLELFQPLAGQYRVYCPDIIGQVGRSATTRPPRSGHHYGRWLIDVLDGLGLERAGMIGLSFGGAVVLDAAAVAPERIRRAVLVVPAGIVGRPLLRLAVEMLVPALLYRLRPSRARLLRLLRPLGTDIDEPILAQLDAVLRHIRWPGLPPGPFSTEQLQRLQAPTLVLLARHDFFVPVRQAIARAQRILPNLAAVEVMDSRHVPNQRMAEWMNERIREFLGSVG